MRACLVLLAAAVCADAVSQPSKINEAMSPIRKVITLIQDMKATCESEAAQDLEAYEKYSCWCKKTEAEKKDDIAAAEQKIADLETFIEESTAKAGELKTQIAGLEDDIAEDKDAIADATAIRQKEHDAFVAEEADMKETRYLLDQAVKTLEKVQLIQSEGTPAQVQAAEAAAATSLVQVREHVQRKFKNFRNTMQKDLFDMLGAFEDAKQGNLRSTGAAFLGEEFRSTTLLPWQKTEEQIGMESKPNDLVGYAAGAKSYNARSGKIVGILKEMHREFTRDLAAAQKAEFEALVAFHQLNAAKLAEIAEATKLKEQKEAELSSTLDAIAKAKEDKAATETALAADREFLSNMLESCGKEDEEYKKRYAVRSEEIQALTETLKILTADDARDLYEKTVSFMQIASTQKMRERAQDHAKERIMQRLGEVAKKNGNWALASVAVRVRLDSFTKVKAALDKMLAELQAQQKEEYAKWETCKSAIDKTEDKIWAEENTKKDLAEKHLGLTNTINTLKSEIAALKKEVSEMEIALKEAGEQRKAQNQLFQQEVSDQRATINILQKALTRLRQFYGFAQVKAHDAAAPEPAKPSSLNSGNYEKSGLSGGVVQMLMKIIEDCTALEGELQVDEQHEQENYAKYVKATTESIEADRALTEEKEGQLASTQAERSEVEEAQLANEQELETLNELLKAHHLDCDYLLKYFNIRQTARQEEMSAITDAKAILSGADYGK